MDYQKDIKNSDSNSYGQKDAESSKILVNKDIYTYSYKKTEKLVTALYMVTDCMEKDDALKARIRNLSVETLSYIHKIAHTSSNPVDNKVAVGTSIMNIDEILSLVGIAHTIGFISDMNATILSHELSNLREDLKINQAKGTHFTFTLDEKIFNLTRPVEPREEKAFNPIKDKRTEYNMSFTNYKQGSRITAPKGFTASSTDKASKIDRALKIISIIKDKKGALGNESGVSIKDISNAFTDCSEKTIQRELNALVSKGSLKKFGAKRWSRYQLA